LWGSEWNNIARLKTCLGVVRTEKKNQDREQKYNEKNTGTQNATGRAQKKGMKRSIPAGKRMRGGGETDSNQKLVEKKAKTGKQQAGSTQT